MASIEMPLVCQAGPAAEAFVGSLHVVKNNFNVKYLARAVNLFVSSGIIRRNVVLAA